jgi:hypothetical protein
LVKTKDITIEERKKKKREISKLLVKDGEIHGYIRALEENKSKISCILYFGLLIFFRNQSRKNIKNI